MTRISQREGNATEKCCGGFGVLERNRLEQARRIQGSNLDILNGTVQQCVTLHRCTLLSERCDGNVTRLHQSIKDLGTS